VSDRIQAPRGTFDVLGDDALARDRLVEIARGILEPAGYERIETPTFESTALFDHCDRPFQPEQSFLDDEGSVLMQGKAGLGLLDDRDLAGYADRAEGLPAIERRTVPARFGFVPQPTA